jgi:Asp-tRNA(Asn)/Glu-tRNA(Gln) amidotransferase A subunit family amidase
MMVYLDGLGAGAAFHSVEEWERVAGRKFPNGLGTGEDGTPGAAPTRPSATEQGDAYQAWRARARTRFREVLAEHELDGLFFPQAAAPSRDLVEDPARPDYSPNNWPEIPSNIVNELGLPTITVPYGYFEDGLPFVVAFIGDTWTEVELLGYAHDFERATRSRRPPELIEKPGG